jgi:hypothetical protein
VAITFDGVNKLATLSAGTTSLSVIDLWSRWEDWVATSDNIKYLPMFASVGGDVIDAGAGTSVPLYCFLLNGWRVKPQEADHTLNVTSGVLLVSGGGDPFVNTTGNYIVRINYSQPVQAITVSTGGGGGGATAADIWSYGSRSLTTSFPSIPTAADTASAVWAKALEGLTAEEMMRVMLAALAGKREGLGTPTEQYMGRDGVTPRITLTADVNGNGTPTVNGAA